MYSEWLQNMKMRQLLNLDYLKYETLQLVNRKNVNISTTHCQMDQNTTYDYLL